MLNFSPYFDYSKFGVIALTEAQADAYWGRSWNQIDYTTTFTSDRISKITTLLSEIGLLAHLNAEEIAEGKRRISRQYITSADQILSGFKDIVLFFDWEIAGGENPYQHFLEDLTTISHGNFHPTDIDDGFDWEQKTASLAFTLNGTRYSTDLAFERDWLDPQFLQFVEEVATAEVSEGQFYPLSDGYGIEGYIFLTENQLEALQSHQLIPLATDSSVETGL